MNYSIEMHRNPLKCRSIIDAVEHQDAKEI